MKNEKEKSWIVIIIGIVLICTFWTLSNKNNQDGNNDTKISDSKILKKEQLINVIPQDVINYTFDDVQYTSTIKEVNVVRENTANGVDTIYCEVYLTDDNFERVAYICLSGGKGTNGWFCENWYSYDDEVIKEWNEKQVKELCRVELYDIGFGDAELISNTRDFDSRGGLTEKFTYNINKDYTNLKANGNFDIKVNVNSLNTNEGYPKEYNSYVYADTSNVNIQWHVAENWYGEDDTFKYNIQIHFNEENGKTLVDIANSTAILKSDENDVSTASSTGFYLSDLEMGFGRGITEYVKGLNDLDIEKSVWVNRPKKAYESFRINFLINAYGVYVHSVEDGHWIALEQK